jgi:hypothetical protein
LSRKAAILPNALFDMSIGHKEGTLRQLFCQQGVRPFRFESGPIGFWELVELHLAVFPRAGVIKLGDCIMF